MDPSKRTFYLGRYNCIEQLGAGPIGETYRAKIYGVAGFEKQFAVKRLHPALSEDEAFVARFVKAASAFAALEHHAIARVHEVNAQGAHYYIVVDLVRGLDIRRLLDSLQQRGEALSADAAMAIALQVADALEYAHSRTNVLPGGVLHLGLTAPSIMVTYDGEAKLVDIGLLGALVRPGWSDDDVLTPSLAYVAPEQWRAEQLDGRADVFSLGVVLHELLGGSRTFISDRAADLRKAIESGPPAPPPSDPRLQEILTRALQPDREKRFATIAEMRQAIAPILGGRAERARGDLSAVVRRLAMPRERRTGAFAAVTLPPAAGASAVVPPPIPQSARAWAPPTTRSMPAVPPPPPTTPPPAAVANANGADDQPLVPIELIELPATSEVDAAPAEEAETHRIQRAPADAVTAVMPPPAPAQSGSAAADAAEGAAAAPASAGDASANGAAPAAATEGSWIPPKLESPAPSPVPTFAAPAVEKPQPIERPKASVPGVKLPPPRGGGRAVIGSIALLAAAGALAIYAGLSGRPETTSSTPSQQPPAATSATQPTTPSGEHAGAPAAAPRASAPAATPTPTPTQPVQAPSGATQAPTPPPSQHAAPSPPQPTAENRPTAGTAENTAPKTGGGFEIVTTPPGATVFVDGEAKGTTPTTLDVASGKHEIVVAAEGDKLVRQRVQVTPTGRLELTLEPARLPSEIAGDAGLKVRCRSHGEIRIFVDGADTGRACPNEERISVAPGPHKIGLLSLRTGEMHEVDHDVVEGNLSTRVYVKY